MGHGQSRPSRSSSDSSFTIMSSSNPTNHSLEEKNSLELSVEEPGESNKVKFTQRMHVQRIPIKRSKFNCFSTKLNRKYDTMVNGYRIVKDIGKGSFAKVKLVEKDGKLFAAKIFDGKFLKRKRTFIFGSVKTMWEGVQTELKILKSLDHPNIVKLYEVIEDPRVDKLILIMEYASGGSLGVSRFSDSECLNESEVKPIFKQLILAVQYLHSLKIVHKDIKPENVLVDDHGDIKLADFSVSMFYAGNEGLVRQHPGTAAFMPPEMCSTENVGDFPISAIDVWSSGISLWFLCFGKCPFIGSSISDTYDKILHEEYDDENIFYFYV